MRYAEALSVDTYMKAAGRNTSSYFGYITHQGKQFIGELPAMKSRLGEIRKKLESLPESRNRSYELVPAG